MARKPTARDLHALEAAQDIAYRAWEAPKAKRRALAEKALATSPLCADAHVILAMEEPAGSAEALAHWQRAVAAGAAALGPAGFREMEGEFWGWLETRPYMRALHGLAGALWAAGQAEDAIAQAREMLRLNPNDNQGVRYELLGWLLAEGRDDEVAALIDTYPEEGMAVWPWARTLLAFRREGAGPAADAALASAIEANSHVAPLLAGTKRRPKRPPAMYGWGDANEAAVVLEEIGAGWMLTPGAIAWLKAKLPPVPARRPSHTSGTGS
ncbi:hypothetical protein GXW74_05070 [Roseomonas eburnea]|uniref:Tetratricopeptide repeat protein n=1 Tax=Neoroseomonas eburnea TaxID=1346889 RepID=A0A9X9X812_9PROT|nr:hypothetical protein [Neoroseomonas eburnea]MBR0679848.1 hypothetical protein [Neoroseomonas eburnea]